MKNYFLISIFFLILHFVSYSQKIDSASVKTKVENKFDSTIVKRKLKNKNSKWGDMNEYYYAYTMNGEKISDNNLDICLSRFKSSRLEYKKSNTSRTFKQISFAASVLGFIGCGIYFMETASGDDPLYEQGFTTAQVNAYNEKETKFGLASVSFFGVGLSAGIIMAILEKHHFKKAIRLYNEEILRRNK